MDTREDMDQGISLVDLYNMVKANIVLILAITFVTTLLAGIYVFTMTETKYKSRSELLVLTNIVVKGDEENPSAQVSPAQLVTTTVTLIKSDAVINKLRDAGNVSIPENLTNDKIKNSITVGSTPNDFVVSITYTSTDKEFAQAMADELLVTILDYLDEKFPAISLSDYISRASVPTEDRANKILYTLVGALIGVAISMVIILLNKLFRNTYNSKEELETGIGIQVLGVIPEYEIKEGIRKWNIIKINFLKEKD